MKKGVIKGINKKYGETVIRTLGDKDACTSIEGIHTGSLGLDIALGGKGLPKGRICEFFGPESSGKSTLALHVVAEVQKSGGTVAYIDAEHAIDPQWATKIGVDIENLLINQPDNAEQGLDIVETLVDSGEVDLIVVDSVAALVPKAELEGEIGQSHIGLQARLMSQTMRKIAATCSNTKTTVIFINQLRMKIGVMFGNPETTPGGEALKYYSSVRLDIRRISKLSDSANNIIGNRVRVKVVKNKIAAPFQQTEFDLLFHKGIDREGSVVDVGIGQGHITQSGAWFTYKDQKYQGKLNLIRHFEETPEDLNELIELCTN